MTLIDIYAAENPVFGAILLHGCAAGYLESAGKGVPYPLFFPVLPLVVSEYTAASFDGTNASTGLFDWLAKRPEVLIGLADAIRATVPFTRTSLVFAIRHRLMDVSPDQRFAPVTHMPWRQPRWRSSDERGRALGLARRLGTWLGRIDDPATLFHRLGIAP
ncbi:three component ABC system middle component [Candidatus Thiosymbion oneisti]|uniref:three component ABC system middle component n=1 Tax=Candidatus Thiosymbion oneisti TaxID=589554 RepID=UPI000B7EABCC|nr:three component ABC system middle component [Candidatus Thiosymbion oneisti]